MSEQDAIEKGKGTYHYLVRIYIEEGKVVPCKKSILHNEISSQYNNFKLFSSAVKSIT